MTRSGERGGGESRADWVPGAVTPRPHGGIPRGDYRTLASGDVVTLCIAGQEITLSASEIIR